MVMLDSLRINRYTWEVREKTLDKTALLKRSAVLFCNRIEVSVKREIKTLKRKNAQEFYASENRNTEAYENFKKRLLNNDSMAEKLNSEFLKFQEKTIDILKEYL